MDFQVIDFDALEERVFGDMDLLDEIIGIFLDRSPEAMTRIRRAVTSGDTKGLEAAAHNLRGYVANLHAKRAADLALEVEIKARHNDWLDMDKLFHSLEREMKLLTRALTPPVQDVMQSL